jgi:hypothetical protein
VAADPGVSACSTNKAKESSTLSPLQRLLVPDSRLNVFAPVMKKIFPPTVFLVAALLSAGSNGDFDYTLSIEGIAHDIAGLKDTYPQLKEFSVAQHLKADKNQISYGYHTHKSAGRGGWTSAVPNPDDDGIWFYIDFHDPGSTRQIHAQPVAIPYCVGAMRLSFLCLEGAKTKRAEGAIWEILKKHGATRCDQ